MTPRPHAHGQVPLTRAVGLGRCWYPQVVNFHFPVKTESCQVSSSGEAEERAPSFQRQTQGKFLEFSFRRCLVPTGPWDRGRVIRCLSLEASGLQSPHTHFPLALAASVLLWPLAAVHVCVGGGTGVIFVLWTDLSPPTGLSTGEGLFPNHRAPQPGMSAGAQEVNVC